ncbi:MAG: ATP-binding protein [Monoglobales bacterium]
MIYSLETENKVKDTYDEKQSKARFLITARREKIYAEIPQIKEIEEQISREGVMLAKASIKGKKYTPQTDIEALAKKRDEIMVQNGYSPDYIYDVYECKSCKDTGYVGSKMCECMKGEYQKQSLAYSNIAPALLDVNIDDFNIKYYSDIPDENGNVPREQMKYILKKCDEFVDEFEKSDVKNLFFFGSTGLGKTFLSAAIAKKIYEKGFSVVYYSAKQLLSMLTDFEFGKAPEKKEACANVYAAYLFIIDDLGSEQQTSFSTSTLFDIINTRMLNGKKLIINTNLGAKDLHSLYSDRIFSRLYEFESLKFIGKDIRVVKNM